MLLEAASAIGILLCLGLPPTSQAKHLIARQQQQEFDLVRTYFIAINKHDEDLLQNLLHQNFYCRAALDHGWDRSKEVDHLKTQWKEQPESYVVVQKVWKSSDRIGVTSSRFQLANGSIRKDTNTFYFYISENKIIRIAHL